MEAAPSLSRMRRLRDAETKRKLFKQASMTPSKDGNLAASLQDVSQRLAVLEHLLVQIHWCSVGQWQHSYPHTDVEIAGEDVPLVCRDLDRTGTLHSEDVQQAPAFADTRDQIPVQADSGIKASEPTGSAARPDGVTETEDKQDPWMHSDPWELAVTSKAIATDRDTSKPHDLSIDPPVLKFKRCPAQSSPIIFKKTMSLTDACQVQNQMQPQQVAKVEKIPTCTSSSSVAPWQNCRMTAWQMCTGFLGDCSHPVSEQLIPSDQVLTMLRTWRRTKPSQPQQGRSLTRRKLDSAIAAWWNKLVRGFGSEVAVDQAIDTALAF